jgi:hypothetical protein
MALTIGDTAPDFEAESTEGPIHFHGGDDRPVPRASRRPPGLRPLRPERLGPRLRAPGREVAALDRDAQLAPHLRPLRRQRDVPVGRPRRRDRARRPDRSRVRRLGEGGVAAHVGHSPRRALAGLVPSSHARSGWVRPRCHESVTLLPQADGLSARRRSSRAGVPVRDGSDPDVPRVCRCFNRRLPSIARGRGLFSRRPRTAAG